MKQFWFSEKDKREFFTGLFYYVVHFHACVSLWTLPMMFWGKRLDFCGPEAD